MIVFGVVTFLIRVPSQKAILFRPRERDYQKITERSKKL